MPPTNGIYNVDGFKYTVENGLVTKVEVALLGKVNPSWDRNGYQQSIKCNKAKNGTQGNDQGGHLIGSQFGGSGEQINLVPMKSSVNGPGGDWYTMEQKWANGGKTITGVEIKIIYGVDKRPTNFLVKWSENGVEMPTIKIENF